jgi:hypothetical protein
MLRCAPLLLVLFFLVTTVSPQAADALALTAQDSTIIPGKRVGLITAYSSLETLRAIYGSASVRSCQLDAAEGELIAGAKLFEGTDRALEIIWAEDGVEKRISDIRILGKAWKFANGLKLGLSVPEVEKINGQAFRVSGFEWDYGGYATFPEGKLSGGVTLRFRPTEKAYSPEARGDILLASDSPALLSAQPVVESITITFIEP